MAKCPHCKGTGVAPIRLPQECIGCQKKITVTFETTEEMLATEGRVWCSECKKEGRDG
jgi:DnaJ-class molecular chaperone